MQRMASTFVMLDSSKSCQQMLPAIFGLSICQLPLCGPVCCINTSDYPSPPPLDIQLRWTSSCPVALIEIHRKPNCWDCANKWCPNEVNKKLRDSYCWLEETMALEQLRLRNAGNQIISAGHHCGKKS